MPIKDINNNLKVFSTARENKKKFLLESETSIFLEFYDREKEGKRELFMARAVF